MQICYSKEEFIDQALNVQEVKEYFKIGRNKAFALMSELQEKVVFPKSREQLIHIEDLKGWCEEQIGCSLIKHEGGKRMFISEHYPDFLTVEETAEILNISKKKVYKLIKTNEISAVHMGQVIRVPANLLGYTIDQMIKEEGGE